MSASNRVTPGIAVSLILILGVLGFLVPQFYMAQEGPDTLAVELDEEETVILSTDLQATLISIDNNPARANVTITDTETGQTEATGTIMEDSSQTVTMNGEPVIVEYQEAIGPNRGLFFFEHPLYYSWPSGAKFFLQFLSGFAAILIGFFGWYLIRGDAY